MHTGDEISDQKHNMSVSKISIAKETIPTNTTTTSDIGCYQYEGMKHILGFNLSQRRVRWRGAGGVLGGA